ncbi:MAG: glycosyltransferase family 9 protein [Bdellovibrionota bacterium]
MKILILQLARFGDIYMTWALTRALKRVYPDSEIHCLVRKRFSDALVGLDAVDKIIELPSQLWAESIVNEAQDDNSEFSNSVVHVDNFISTLKSENYAKIINASFSPLSSYLTHAITENKDEVFGYTRFDDGTFHCKDSISLYFYSQVGEERSNRYHVTDLLAAMVDVDLVGEDYSPPSQEFGTTHTCHPQKTILLHVGASQRKKALAGFQWGRIVKSFLQQCPEFEIALVGSPQEKYIAEEILAHNPNSEIKSYVGITRVPQLFDLLKNSHSLMACDSMAIHMADLTKTPCFNLSFKTVNFWETGPLAAGSVVYQADIPETINSLDIATKWAQFVHGENVQGVFHTQKKMPRFYGATTVAQDFQWQLLQALYLNEPFPITDDALFCECIEKIHQLNDIFIDNLKKIQKKPFPHGTLLLNQAENNMMSMGRYHPAISLLLRWYRGRKIMVAPAKQNEIINEYLKIHLEFRSLLKVYLWSESEELTLKKE